MRIAVCFYGQLRPGAVGSSLNILRYLGNLRPYCDVFVHTWDTKSLGTNHAKLTGAENVCDPKWFETHYTPFDNFSKFYSIMKPRMMQVEEHNLQETRPLWGGRRFDPVTKKWNVSMWRSIQEVNKFKGEYARKNNIKYDYTLVMRSDVVFSSEKSLEDDIKQVKDGVLLFGDHKNVWPGHGLTRLEELLWLGTSEVIDKVSQFSEYYSSNVKNLDDPSDPEYRDWQLYISPWCINTLGIYFSPLANNKIRVFSIIDVESGADPMNPCF